jgi:hypothetical protein
MIYEVACLVTTLRTNQLHVQKLLQNSVQESG